MLLVNYLELGKIFIHPNSEADYNIEKKSLFK